LAAHALDHAASAIAIDAATNAGSAAATTGGIAAYCAAFRFARETSAWNERATSARIVRSHFEAVAA
jgi:hypothetical protein